MPLSEGQWTAWLAHDPDRGLVRRHRLAGGVERLDAAGAIDAAVDLAREALAGAIAAGRPASVLVECEDRLG